MAHDVLAVAGMFGSLTRLFRGSAAKRQTASPPPVAPLAAQNDAAGFETGPVQAAAGLETLPSDADSVTLPFSSIIKQVPPDLHGKTGGRGGAGVSFSMSRAQVLEQLSHGSVKVSFGELRQAAPAGMFLNSSTHDDRLIDLPLAEIMAQLQGEAFARRAGRKRVDVPSEIADLFGQQGQPLAEMRVLDKSEAPKAAPAVRARVTTPAKSTTPAATPVPAVTPTAAVTPVTARIPFPNPSAPVTAAEPRAPITFPKPPSQTAAPALRLQKPQATAEPAPTSGEPSLVVALAALAEHWPEAIRAEIEQLDLRDAFCELPLAEIGPALRAGKVQCRWKQIRLWINSTVRTPSSHGETSLELPLKILAPIYMEHCRHSRSTRKVSVAENIPDLFNKEAAAPSAPLKPVPASPPSPSIAAPVSEAPAAAEPEEPEAAPETEPATDVPTQQPAFLSLPLSLVAESWPDQVRKDVDLCNLAEAKLEVPFEVIEEGLKQGRLNFRWKQVCQWLNPPPPPSMASSNLETQVDYRVDLPLNFIAPLYLQHRSASGAKKSGLAAEIPDMFGPTGQRLAEAPATAPAEEPAPAVSAAPQETSVSAPVRNAPAKGARKPGEALAELFGEPDKRTWTPNDIVHKTSTLPGVAGALIALQDGLLVASCMPPTWKTETISAFLPQIFGRMRQYTNELKMGELHSVAFSVEEGTLHIFNAGIIYFAALSQIGASLPMTELYLIAKEISRHTR